MLRIEFNKVDVLILGAGLAGLRAAWAVRQEAPDLSLCVVSQQRGPSGSSFSNINDMLGMQVCLRDSEKEEFLREAVAIAAPGEINPGLAAILAEDSLPRMRDLESAGLIYNKDVRGRHARLRGCFSSAPRAVVFSGLSTAFDVLKRKAVQFDGELLEGWTVQDLVRDEHSGERRICGAMLKEKCTARRFVVQAGAVIVALGGPASLFQLNIAGPGTPGFSYALLQRQGAALINTAFLQFMWHRLPRRQFWPVQNLNQSGWMFRAGGEDRVLPERFNVLTMERARHCPVAYGLADAAIDQFLAEHLNASGCLEVCSPGDVWYPVGLMAHAGNGGARIDAHGWTGVHGLYACGESASGMHGANRIGGAMVLSTQVFGERAGRAAARHAQVAGSISDRHFRQAAKQKLSGLKENECEWTELSPKIASGLQRFAILAGRPGLADFLVEIRKRLTTVVDWRCRLALESALIIGSNAMEE